MTPVFAVGDRVVVLQHSEYCSKFVNEQGEVIKTFKLHSHIMYGVKLDNHSNSASAKGLYWFEARSIKSENNEREDLNMFNNFIVAEVEFLDNPKTGRYAYALYDTNVKEGNTVVVSTGHHGFALAKVVAIYTEEGKKEEVKGNREVVCRVDFTAFNDRKEVMKKVTELKRKMEQHIREAQELALYEALAEKNPTLKDMFDEYKALIEYGKEYHQR